MLGEIITNTINKLRLTAKLRIQFYRAMQTLQKGNVQLDDALNDISRIYSKDGKKRHNVLAMMAEDGAHGYASGNRLHTSLSDWLPPDELSILAAGSPTGKMEEAFQQAAKLAHDKRMLLRGVIAELTQPTVLSLVAAGVLYSLAVDVIPDFLNNRDPNEPLDGAAFNLYWFSYAIKNFWWLILAMGVGGVLATYISLSRWTGRVRVFFERFPPWSLYREIQGCVFLMNVAVLQRSGLIVQEALMQMKEYATPWLRERIELTLVGLAQGQNLGEALENADCSFPSEKSLPFLRILAAQDGADDHIAAYADERLADCVVEIKGSCALISVFVILGVAIIAGGITAGIHSLSSI